MNTKYLALIESIEECLNGNYGKAYLQLQKLKLTAQMDLQGVGISELSKEDKAKLFFEGTDISFLISLVKDNIVEK